MFYVAGVISHMYRIRCAVAIATILAASAAQAANITEMSGQASVNVGNGFQPIDAATPLLPGDMVMVAGGLVQIRYSCGVTHEVVPGAVYTVKDDAKACAGGFPLLGIAAVGAVIGGGILIFSNNDSNNNSNRRSPPPTPASP